MWCWGSNSFGQLGNGTDQSVKKPAQVPKLGNVSAISTAGQHMAALKKDGTVWCWGDNWSNELGDGTRNNSNRPVQAKELSGITYAAACGGCTARYLDDGAEVSAASYTLVIKKDGTLWGWVNNEKGQLGDGSNVDRQKPVQAAISGGSKLPLPLPKPSQVKKVIPGSAKGQDTAQEKKNIPGPVKGQDTAQVKKVIPGPAKGQDTSKDESDKKPLSAKLIHDGADAIAAGFGTTIVIKTDGTVSAWGKNMNKECDVPAGLSGVKAIAGGFGHTVALKKDGTVVEWGKLIYGMPSGLTGIKAIAAGEGNTVALRKDGTVIAWGHNDYGRCNVPKGLKGVQAITAGVLHTVALKEDGTVAAWGYNASGQCKVPKGLNGVKAVAAGKDHTAALKEDGTVIVWGSNKKGQCNVPEGLKGVTAISAGCEFTTALKADGTVVLWGNAGDNRFNVPYGLKGVTAIAAGWFHVVVLKEDGTVVAWGNCTDGECNVPVGAFQTNVFKVSFNRPVDMAKASFAITGESIPVGLGGPIQWSESGKAAYLKTAGSLADGEYKVTVAGLSSTPLIASCIINNPMSITVAAAQPNTLSVKFNKTVDAASFAISTSANPKNTIVPNSVAWSADKKTVNLGLPGTLEANMTYVVTVTGLTSGPISASVLTNAGISTGYVAGYEIGMNQGAKYIKLDNSNGNADIVVKIININGSSRSAIRIFNIKKGDSFTANNIPEGSFVIRYKLLNTGSVQETGEFSMGSQHSGVTIIINPTKDANLNTNRISEF
jgi:alpha-tubulin suppressor-like RCC1 family protein